MGEASPKKQKTTESIQWQFALVARPTGLEPVTPRFVVWYSIQLSYGRMAAFIAAEVV